MHAPPEFLRDPAAQGRGIHPSAIVAASVIGSNVDIGPRAVIGEQVKIGDGTTIGASCVIGDGVKIGAHCRIDANVTIYAGTTLGDRVVIQAGAVLGSDGFGYVRDQQTGRYEQFPQIGRLVIEDDVEIGANSTIDRGALDETRIRRGTKIDNLVHVGHNVQDRRGRGHRRANRPLRQRHSSKTTSSSEDRSASPITCASKQARC